MQNYKLEKNAFAGEVTDINTMGDAPTIYADAIGAVVVAPSVVKIGFTEHTDNNSGKMVSRFVATLVLSRQHLALLHEVLGKVIESEETSVESGA